MIENKRMPKFSDTDTKSANISGVVPSGAEYHIITITDKTPGNNLTGKPRSIINVK